MTRTHQGRVDQGRVVVASQLFRQEALNYQAEKHWGKCIDLNAMRMSVLALLLLLMVVISGWFLATGDYKRKTSVKGTLVTDRGAVQIRSPTDGMVEVMSVAQGERVGKGDTLLVINPGISGMDGMSVASRLIEKNRQQSELIKAMTSDEHESHRVRVAQLISDIENLEQQQTQLTRLIANEGRIRDLLNEKFRRLQILSQKQLLALNDLESIRIERLQQENNLHQLLLEQGKNQKALQEAAGRKKLLVLEHQQRLAGFANDLADLQKQQLELASRQSLTIVSPVNGKVAVINKMAGETVLPRQILFSLIQEDSILEAELYIPSRAVGFVQPGLAVNMRFDAFPHQKFGLQPARVKEVAHVISLPGEPGSDAERKEAFYKVRAVLDKQSIKAFGDMVSLKPGMNFTADIVLESRSLFEWILEPLYIVAGR